MDIEDLKRTKIETTNVDLHFGADEKLSGFTVLGSNSEQYQDVARKWHLKNIKNTARGRSVDAGTEDGASQLVDRLTSRDKEIVYACIVGIYGFESQGQPVALNNENLDTIFAARPTWLARVLASIENERLFMKG